MKMDRTYLDHQEYFPEHILIPKSVIASIALSADEKGLSNIKAQINATSNCRSIIDEWEKRGSDVSDRRKKCEEVMESRALYMKALQEYNKYKDGAFDDRKLMELSEELSKCKEAFLSVCEKNCAGCANYKNIRSRKETRRVNYKSIEKVSMGVAETKTYLSLYLMLRSDVPHWEDVPADYTRHFTDISIRHLMSVSGLSDTSLRYSLEALRDKKIIEYSSCFKGVYSIRFTLEEDQKKYISAKEGGYGYIALPFDAVKMLLYFDKIDTIRTGLALILNIDDNLYDGTAHLLDDDSLLKDCVRTDMSYLRFIKKRPAASLKHLLETFSSSVQSFFRNTGEENRTFILSPEAPSSSKSFNDGRYDQVKVLWPSHLTPKQYSYHENVTAAGGQIYKLGRKISDKARSEARAAFNLACSDDFNSAAGDRGNKFPVNRLNFMFPFLDGRRSITEELRSVSLFDAVETVSQRIGVSFVRESLIETLNHYRSEIITAIDDADKLIKDGFKRSYSESGAIKDLIDRMTAYMTATAHAMRGALFENWRLFEQTVNA